MRFIILFLTFLPAFFQAQELNWVARYGGTFGGTSSSTTTNGDYVKEVAIDGNGNVISIGYAAGSAIFDNVNQPQITTAANNLIIKLSEDGEFLWSLTTGLGLNSIALDFNGNIILVGYFAGTVDFDPSQGEDFRTSAGGWDIGVIKLAPDGSYIWGYQAGTENGLYETANDCVIDDSGRIYVTGSFSNTCDFNNGAGIENLIGGLDDNLFILQLESNGQLGWVRGVADLNSAYTQGYGIDLNSTGQLVVVGQVGTSGLSSIDINTDDGIVQYWNNLSTMDNADVIVLSLNSNGNFLWGNTYDFDGVYGVDDWASVVDFSESGEIFIAGRLESGDPSPELDPLLALSGDGLFVVKLTSNGQFSFGKAFNDINGGTAHFSGIRSNMQGLVALKGYGSQTLDLDPGEGEVFQAPNSSFILFLQSEDGNFSSYMPAGANSQNITRTGNFVFDDNGHLLFGGGFRQTFDFIPGAEVNSLTSYGGLDGFIASYDINECVGLSASADYSIISCNTALVEINVDGGTEPYLIDWPNEISPTGAYTGTTLTTGSLNILVTDNAGCSLNAVVNISNYEPFEITAAQNDTLICSNLTASFAVTTVNGAPPFNYVWNNDLTYNTPEFETSIAGEHSVIVTDALGCEAEMSFTAVNSTLALNPADNFIESCPGTFVTIGAEATGGAPPYTYSWNPPPPFNPWNPYITVYYSGSYVQTVTDALGCEMTEEYLVVEYPDLTSMSLDQDYIWCNETESTTSVQLSGAFPPIQYLWDGIEGDELHTFNDLDSSGWYNVQTIFSDEFGCYRSRTKTFYFHNYINDNHHNPWVYVSALSSWVIDNNPDTEHYSNGRIVTNRCILPPHTLVLHNAELTNPNLQGYTTVSANGAMNVYYHSTSINNPTLPNSSIHYATTKLFAFKTNDLCEGSFQFPGEESVFIEVYTTLDNIQLQYNHQISLVCAYDPNDMQASPMGICASNYIERDSLQLTYTVRFQNYGNASASEVVILDTLSYLLEASSFEFVDASPFVPSIELLEDSILRFIFDEINLPPISVDSNGSQGFVTFRIKTIDTNIQNGSVLQNSASIYFDTNLPILTNTVSHTIVDELPDLNAPIIVSENGLETTISGSLYSWFLCENDSLVTTTNSPFFAPFEAGQYYVVVNTDDCKYNSACITFVGINKPFEHVVSIYPNPANNEINFHFPGSSINAITIMDKLGRCIASSIVSGDRFNFKTSNLPSGIYFIEGMHPDGRKVRKRFMVLH